MRDDAPGMPANARAEWAREMIMQEIDTALRNRFWLAPGEMGMEEDQAALRQRNRVARLFRMKTKTYTEAFR